MYRSPADLEPTVSILVQKLISVSAALPAWVRAVDLSHRPLPTGWRTTFDSELERADFVS